MQYGLVCKVVPREGLEEETFALARQIANNKPVAISLVKRSINYAEELMGKVAAFEYNFLTHQLAHVSDEAKKSGEEVANVLNKRNR